MSTQAHIRDIICSDLDPDFIKSLSISIGWEYSLLYETLADDPTLTDPYRAEEFGKRRGHSVVKALANTSKRFRIPVEFRRLECNGQRKILVKAGRVVLIPEPMLTLDENPRTSEYKRELADSHGIIRQLELDLGDQPYRIRDWSGCVLAVLLHGAAGPRFTRDHKALGGLMLGVPDAAYSHWTLRLDLLRIALFGFGDVPVVNSDSAEAHQAQTDEVYVTLKSKKYRKEGPE